MKFSISKTDFANAIGIAMKGRSARATLPILSGIYIQATHNALVLQATDLEMSVRHTVPAAVEEQGEVVVPGKLIDEIVRSLPDAAISCKKQGEMFNVECMSSSFSLTTMNPTDFPAFPSIEISERISLPAKETSQLVKKVSKAVSKDESHVILTGISLTVEDGHLTMAATDSYRLAIGEMQVEDHQGLFSLIVPGRTFDEICKLSSKEEILTIGYTDNQICFEFGNSTFITRKLEGNYPNYKQIIPKEKTVTATIDTKQLQAAIKRASIMAQEYMQVRLHLSPDAQQITVSSKVADIGGAEEKLDAQIEGDEIVIGFNYQYIMDGLTSIDTEEVMFEANQPLRPGILKAVGGDNFFYLSMPVKLSE